MRGTPGIFDQAGNRNPSLDSSRSPVRQPSGHLSAGNKQLLKSARWTAMSRAFTSVCAFDWRTL
jgi:hypothetical protein